MRFLVADTFTASLANLDARMRAAAKRAVFDFLTHPDSPGLRPHRLVHTQESGFWSLRVSRDVRIIVHRTAGVVVFCHADRHDKAYAWAEHHKLQRHPATSTADVFQVVEHTHQTTAARVARPRSTASAPARIENDVPAEESPPRVLSPRRLRVRRRAVAPLAPTRAQVSGASGSTPLTQLLRLSRRLGPAAGSAARPPASSAARASGGALASQARAPRGGLPLHRKVVAIEVLAAAVTTALVCVLVRAAASRNLANGAALVPVAGVAAGLLVAVSGVIASRSVATAIRGALAESVSLRDEVCAGRLSIRAARERLDPELWPVLQVMNETVEAFVSPLARTTGALGCLSRGDIPRRLVESLGAGFDEQRDAINALVDFLSLRAEDIRLITDIANDAGRKSSSNALACSGPTADGASGPCDQYPERGDLLDRDRPPVPAASR